MPQGIPVSIIKPGPVKTNIWETARRGSTVEDITPEGRALYGDLIDRVRPPCGGCWGGLPLRAAVADADLSLALAAGCAAAGWRANPSSCTAHTDAAADARL